LHPGARMYALSEGSATLKYAQIVVWLDLKRLVLVRSNVIELLLNGP